MILLLWQKPPGNGVESNGLYWDYKAPPGADDIQNLPYAVSNIRQEYYEINQHEVRP